MNQPRTYHGPTANPWRRLRQGSAAAMLIRRRRRCWHLTVDVVPLRGDVVAWRRMELGLKLVAALSSSDHQEPHHSSLAVFQGAAATGLLFFRERQGAVLSVERSETVSHEAFVF